MVDVVTWLAPVSMAIVAVVFGAQAVRDSRDRRKERALLSVCFGALLVGELLPAFGILALVVSFTALVGVAVVSLQRM